MAVSPVGLHRDRTSVIAVTISSFRAVYGRAAPRRMTRGGALKRWATLGGSVEGIWDDGEWTGWDEISRHIYLNDLRDNYPHADPEVVEVFHDLVESAAQYRELTGRHLNIFGELGELYAEVKFGIKRHRLYAAGSDGRLGNDFIEIKTIGPGNRSNKVRVKRSGNFSKVMVVRITDDYGFEARMVERKVLRKGSGKWITLSWSSLPAADAEDPPTSRHS